MCKIMLTFAAMLGLLLFSGCGSYVNVPAAEGDSASHDPQEPTAQLVTTVALRKVIGLYPPGSATYGVKLPEGVSDTIYDTTMAQLPPGAYRLRPDNPSGLATYEVAQVFVRRWLAQVDIVRTTPGGNRQVVTTNLSWQIVDGWMVDNTRAWSIPVEQALEQSRAAAQFAATQPAK